jgi:hypothetical protein
MSKVTHSEAAEILFYESSRLLGQAQFGLATCDTNDASCEICARERRSITLLMESMKRLHEIMSANTGKSPVMVPMDVGDFHDLSDNMTFAAAALYPDLDPHKVLDKAMRELAAADAAA